MIVGGRYRLDAPIGKGGYALVFRATELRLDRPVAIKLFGRNSVDAAGHERFRREAELARRLQHPNTVRLLDFDVFAEPMPYIAYELLEGEDLGKILKREGAQSEERTAHLAKQILKSLMESHAVGVVHRDIKPANVFVCTYAGERDFVKVLDFGIAKSTRADTMQLTADGMVVGTPRYMPPEQIKGQTPSPGMDLYSVGMMMAEMLQGTPVLRGSPADACMKQLSPEPIEFPLKVVAARLWSVIRHAVEKDAAKRTPSAAAMIEEIDAAMHSTAPPALRGMDAGPPRPAALPSSPRPAAGAPPVTAAVGGTVVMPPEEPALSSSQVRTTVMADPSRSAPNSSDAETVLRPLASPPTPVRRGPSPLLIAIAVIAVLAALAVVAVAAVFVLRGGLG